MFNDLMVYNEFVLVKNKYTFYSGAEILQTMINHKRWTVHISKVYILYKYVVLNNLKSKNGTDNII